MLRTDEEIRVTLAAEEAEITRRERVTGLVRIETRTEQRVEPVTIDLQHHEVEIERVAIGRPVDSPPAIRQEGDVTVIPVVEETVVIERRLMLKEEIRVRRVRQVEHHTEQVTLRTQHADIRRLPVDGNSDGAVPPETMTEK